MSYESAANALAEYEVDWRTFLLSARRMGTVAKERAAPAMHTATSGRSVGAPPSTWWTFTRPAAASMMTTSPTISQLRGRPGRRYFHPERDGDDLLVGRVNREIGEPAHQMHVT